MLRPTLGSILIVEQMHTGKTRQYSILVDNSFYKLLTADTVTEYSVGLEFRISDRIKSASSMAVSGQKLTTLRMEMLTLVQLGLGAYTEFDFYVVI